MSNFFTDMFIARHGDEHDHDHDHDHEEEGSPVIAKVVAMCVLFLASFIIGCLPIKLAKIFHWDKNAKNNRVVQFLLCLGGGVLLCTTFLHLLPEVAEQIQEMQSDGTLPELKIHFAEFLMCVGFFTMYLVEEIVHYYLHRKQKNSDMCALRRSLSVRRGDVSSVSTSELVKSMEEAKPNPLEFHNSHRHSEHSGHSHVEHSHSEHAGHSHVGHSHVIIDAEDSIVQSIRGLLVVLALSVHELFEGLAVGLESAPSNVWYMFGAVSAHKLVIAFCIGVELVSTKTRTILTVIYVFTFAVVSPLGIGIGILVSGDGESETAVASVILQGLASGTLLYVVFFEILQAERKGGILQWLAVFVGFLLMFIITLFAGHEHSHGGHEHEHDLHETSTHVPTNLF